MNRHERRAAESRARASVTVNRHTFWGIVRRGFDAIVRAGGKIDEVRLHPATFRRARLTTVRGVKVVSDDRVREGDVQFHGRPS